MSHSPKASPSKPYVPDITLDRSSPIPLYFQICEPIAELINSGTLPADTRLEDELSMAARLCSASSIAASSRDAAASAPSSPRARCTALWSSPPS